MEHRHEQRKFPRFAVELLCVYGFEQGTHWQGTSSNLSSGGCAIRGAGPAQKGDYLQVLIFLSRSEPAISIRVAPVRWSTQEEFGVEFITLERGDAQRLHAYLSTLGEDVAPVLS